MTYNPNEPRDQGGKWATGGSGGAPDEDAERISATANSVATELGYDPTKISIRTDDKTFQLNGKTYNYAGAAYLETGKIELFAKQLSPSSVGPTTAHEIGHQKFQSFFDAYQAEYKQMAEATKDLPSVKDYMSADGMLKGEWAEKFPLYQTYTEVMKPSITEQFAVSDGITPYSEEWWKAWKDGKANTMQAFHETIAEMTAREYVQGPTYEQEADKFKAAGYSLDLGHEYSVRKWKTETKVSPDELPPPLKSSLERLTAGLGKRKKFWSAALSYKDPAPEWVALYDAVNAHWDSKKK